MLVKSFSTLTLLALALPLSAQQMAGKTMIAKGDVQAITDETQEQRSLKRRAPVFNNDVVSTGEKSRAQLRMTDGGMVALKANSELVIAEYQYSEADGKGSMVMELVKGGLRSVTGKIKSESGDYKLKTPVGSIGIRGTHYEVELVGGDMFIAVWDGAIDINVDTGQLAGTTVSFGDGEDYSYAAIDGEGNVTELLEPPENFDSGVSSDVGEADSEESEDTEAESTETEESEESTEQGTEEESEVAGTQDSDEGSSSEGTSTEGESAGDDGNIEGDTSDSTQQVATTDTGTSEQTQESEAAVIDVTVESEIESAALLDNVTADIAKLAPDTVDEEDLFTDEVNDDDPTPLRDLIANQTGTLTYNKSNLLSGSASASGLIESSFRMSMQVDFNTLGVKNGQLSIDDNGGTWRAVFSGNVEQEGAINLEVSHASHGNNLAEGDINGTFIDGIDGVNGSFDLKEIEQPGNNVNGSFEVKK